MPKIKKKSDQKNPQDTPNPFIIVDSEIFNKTIEQATGKTREQLKAEYDAMYARMDKTLPKWVWHEQDLSQYKKQFENSIKRNNVNSNGKSRKRRSTS